MDRKLTIGRVGGIPVDIHGSWPPVFLFVTWMLATRSFPQLLPRQPDVTYWLIGLVASCLLFASLLAHEYAHAIVARRRGLPVLRIGLFFLGGVVEIEVDRGTAIDELCMAVAGPAASLALGVGFAATWLACSMTHPYVGAIAIYLALANVLLAGFNLLPGFPLDGGRLLRACLWMLTREHRKATRWACWLGQILGGLGLALGLESLATGGLASAGWLGAVGAFLLFSARSAMPATRPAPHPASAAVTSQRRGLSLWRSNS